MALTDYRDYARIEAGDDPNILGLLPAPNNDAGIAVDPIGALWLYVNTNAPGSKWVKQEEHYIKHVDNYTALRALSNYTPSAVILRDFTYTGPDGNTYTTLGGLFKKVTTGTENGSTIIVATDGTKWERDWDRVNFIPDWFECGGYDRNGIIYTNKHLTNTGIYSDADRLDNAAKFLIDGKGGTKVRLLKRTYEVDRPIVINSTDGGGATLKHIRPTPVTNTVAYVAGQTTITVSDASQFRVGQFVVLTDNSKTNGGVGYAENFSIIFGNPNLSITSISGNVITLSEAATQSVPVNNSFAAAPMMALTENNSIIENVNFDGNGQTNANTVDFRFTNFISNNSAEPTIAGEHTTIFYGCRFDNIVGTAYYGSSFKILSCFASNVGGGIYHYAGGGVGQAGLFHNCQIDGLQASNMGYIDPYISYHQEALFTFSTNTRNVSINNVNVFGLKNAVFGVASQGHHTFELSNSTFEGERPSWATNTKPHLLGKFQVGAATPFSALDQQRIFRISNCSFNTCGDMVFQGQDIADGENVSNIIITNNQFNNVRVGAYSTSHIIIKNNKFTNIPFGGHTTYTYPISLFSPFLSTAQITANFCDRVEISNNYLEGQEVYSAFLDYGIQTQMRQIFRETSGGVNTKTWYSSNIKLNGNTVIRYSFGIGNIQRYDDALSNWNGGHPNWGNGVHVGCEINNNIIQFHKDAQYSNIFHPIWGIMAMPGVDVKNNKIYHPLNAPTNSVRSIMAWGINNAHRTELLGGLIENNLIWSPSGIINIIIGTGAGGDGMEDNVIVKGNGTSGTVYSLNGYQIDNYNLQTVFPHLTNPLMNPDLSGWMQNISQY